MDRLFEKEKAVLSETILKKKKGSFIYEFHYNNFFDKNKLNDLLHECKSLSDLYRIHGKSEKYPAVVKGVVLTFQHALFLISCHFQPDDVFIISNYSSDLSSEIIFDYYMEFRLMLNELIT